MNNNNTSKEVLTIGLSVLLILTLFLTGIPHTTAVYLSPGEPDATSAPIGNTITFYNVSLTIRGEEKIPINSLKFSIFNDNGLEVGYVLFRLNGEIIQESPPGSFVVINKITNPFFYHGYGYRWGYDEIEGNNYIFGYGYGYGYGAAGYSDVTYLYDITYTARTSGIFFAKLFVDSVSHLYESGESTIFSVSAIYPPVPQLDSIIPEKWSVMTDVMDFVYDFNDLEGDLAYIKLRIFGPPPYDNSSSRIQFKFVTNETDVWEGWDNESKALAQDMGISPSYNASLQQWTITINTSKIWTGPNPWMQPVNASVWPAGKYDFHLEVGDSDGNSWGGLIITPEYAHYVYSFHAIQPAIDAIDDGGTIHVYSGTYNERIMINKTINLVGLGTSTVIQPTDIPQIGVYDVELAPGSSNTVIQNFLFDFNGANDTRGGTGITVSNLNQPAVNNVQILNNTIYVGDRSGVGGTGIRTGRNSDVSGLLVQDNIFYGDATGTSEGIYVTPFSSSGDGVKIYKNGFYGYLYSGVTIEASNVHLSRNRINSTTSKGIYGVQFIDFTGGQTYDGVSIISNDIQNVQYGICVGTSTDIGSTLSATIASNTVSNNDVGIWTRYGADLANSIHFNNIFNNSNFGVNNAATTLVNATFNWWGDATGPYHPTLNPGGLGDNVSGNVDFSNWLESYWYNIVWVDDNYDNSTPGWGIDHFDTITDGLNAVFDGGEVQVKPGIYEELIKIDKPLKLESFFDDPSLTTITDSGATYSELLEAKGQTIRILSSDVVIDGLRVVREEGFDFAVPNVGAIGNYDMIDRISNISIRNCSIQSTSRGIYLTNVEELSISYNDALCGNGTDMFLRSVDGFEINRNNMTNITNNGIVLNLCTEGTITNNNISDKLKFAANIDGCFDILICNNKIKNNTNGILVGNSLEVELRTNSILNNVHGICLQGDSIVFMENNSFVKNEHDLYNATYVESTYYYGTIQNAVYGAGVGCNVYVFPGYYMENVVIDKSVYLYGSQDAQDSVIDGGYGDAAVYIAKYSDAMDINIGKLTIQGGNSCIRTGRFNDISGLKIESCIIKNPLDGYAVYIDPHQYSDYPPIRNGTLPFSKSVVLYDNEIRGGTLYQYKLFELHGVDINTQLVLMGNDIDRAFLNGSTAISIRDNTFWSLGMQGSYGVYIRNNEFVNQPGDERYGICLWSVKEDDSVRKIDIINNSIIGYSNLEVTNGVSGKGIAIAGAEKVTINENDIRANSEGIWITEDYINLNGDQCAGKVSNIVIESNDIINDNIGIALSTNVNATSIIKNTLRSNGIAIRLNGSNENTIADGFIIGNTYGIRLDQYSNNNLVYNNYFSSNAIHAIDLSYATLWNVSLIDGLNIMGGPKIGGNYWDDYMGEDLDGDLIGDTEIPYNSSGNIFYGGDYLPLIFLDTVLPEVEVISPNGGEIFNDTSIVIQWTASDDMDEDLVIDIKYSNDSGTTWNLISSNEENDGEYLWGISHLPEGYNYMVMITAFDNSGNEKNDTSDGTFTIAGQTYPGPEIILKNPVKGWMYFFDNKAILLFQKLILVFGHVTIEAEIISPLDIEKVEFYIDDELVNTDYVPDDDIYRWTWDQRALFYHSISVKAYDMSGQSSSKSLGVIIFNFNIVP